MGEIEAATHGLLASCKSEVLVIPSPKFGNKKKSSSLRHIPSFQVTSEGGCSMAKVVGS